MLDGISVERGWYSDLNEPFLSLNLQVAEEKFHALDVVVDTGFNRSLLIYEEDALAAALPPSRSVVSKMYLADGSQCKATRTFGYLKWLGQLQEVEILVVKGSRGPRDHCLIGMEMLRGNDILLREAGFEVQALPPAPSSGES